MKHIRKFESNDPIEENTPVPKKYSGWQLSDKIEKIVNSNIKEIPWEGTEVDKGGLIQDILSLIHEIAPEYKPKDNNY